MSLVQYSDSEPESEMQQSNNNGNHIPGSGGESSTQKQKEKSGESAPALPPLPAEFRDLYSVPARVSIQDDPSLHNGRTRSIPHVAGNWPTHVYLEWYPTHTEVTALSETIRKCQNEIHGDTKIHSFLYSDLGAQLPLHISLSRPVVLLTEERQDFIEAFRQQIYSSYIRPFQLVICGLHWVPNFDRTRWFLVLRVNRPSNDELNCLLRISNEALGHFNQPPLYEDLAVQKQPLRNRKARDLPSASPQPTNQADYSEYFHISIAWSLTEPSTEEKSRILSLDLKLLEEMRIGFDCVKVKIGNHIHNEVLPTKVINEDGFIGV